MKRNGWKSFCLLTICLALLLAVSGCGGASEVLVDPLVTPEPVVYAVQTVVKQDLSLNRTLNAWLDDFKVEYIEESSVAVFAPETEELSAELQAGFNLLYKPKGLENGGYVREGEVLCRIENTRLEEIYASALQMLADAKQSSDAQPEDEALKAEVEKLQRAVDEYGEQREALTLYAPKTGCVEFTFLDGSAAASGGLIATIYDCELVYRGPLFKEMFVGDQGIVTYSLQNTSYERKVTVTYNQGGARRDPALNDNYNYAVTLSFNDDMPIGKDAMPIVTFYGVVTRKGAICIPVNAVYTDEGGRTYIQYLTESGKTKLCYIVGGITSQDGALLEVVESQFELRDGDKLVIGS